MSHCTECSDGDICAVCKYEQPETPAREAVLEEALKMACEKLELLGEYTWQARSEPAWRLYFLQKAERNLRSNE